jgi:hypothetical protein
VQELMSGLDADARRVLFALLGQLKQSAANHLPEAAA